MKKLRFFELSLALGLMLSLFIVAYASNSQAHLAEKMTRLHVIANSDSKEDQQLKLLVRDKVIALSSAYTARAKTPEQARKIIVSNLDNIKNAAQEVVYSNGYTYPVYTEMANMYFTTRHYETFSLPAGYYDACRVIIGEGKGKNWWCVMFPPLCLSAAQADMESAAQEAGLTDEECKLIASGKTVYRCKFKIIEWVSEIRKHLEKNC